MTVRIETLAVPSRDYLAGESPDYLRMAAKHQGGRHCNFTVIHCHDGSYHLVPSASVIAAHPIIDAGQVHDVCVGDTVMVDGDRYVIRDDVPLHNPQLIKKGV